MNDRLGRLMGLVLFLALAIIVRVAYPFYCAWTWLKERLKRKPPLD